MKVCSKCGTEMVPGCSVPGCTSDVEVYSRIVGYLRPISTWNPGKAQEFRERMEYELGEHELGEYELGEDD